MATVAETPAPLAGLPVRSEGPTVKNPCDTLRSEGPDKAVLFIAVLWIVFVINGFRMPWTPIEVSDKNSGGAMRQLVFTGATALGVRRMLFTGSFNACLGFHTSLLVLGLWMVSSVLYSNDIVLTAKRSILYMFGFFLLVCRVHMVQRPMQSYLRTIVYVTAGCAWVSLIAHFIFPKNCTTIAERPGLAGISGHPNTLGPCLFMAICLALGITPVNARERFWLRVSQAGLWFAIALSNSVTALFATIIGNGFFIVLTAKAYMSGLIQVVSVVGATTVMLIGVDNVKGALFEAAGRDASLSGRDTLWADVFNAGMKSPIFGSGYGAFWYEGRGREITGTWNPRQSHNAYIDVFVDVGAIGLLYVLYAVHLRLMTTWYRVMGHRGTEQRRAVAALFAMGTALCYVGAFGESFLLKMEKFQFFAFAWGIMVLENRDRNRIENEFAEDNARFDKEQRKRAARKQADADAHTAASPA